MPASHLSQGLFLLPCASPSLWVSLVSILLALPQVSRLRPTVAPTFLRTPRPRKHGNAHISPSPSGKLKYLIIENSHASQSMAKSLLIDLGRESKRLGAGPVKPSQLALASNLATLACPVVWSLCNASMVHTKRPSTDSRIESDDLKDQHPSRLASLDQLALLKWLSFRLSTSVSRQSNLHWTERTQ